MRRRLTAILVCLVLGTLSGCGDTHDSLRKEAIATANEIADTLASIKDKASADTAKPKLKKLGDKLRDLKARDDKLGKVSADEQKKLDEKYKKDADALMDRLSKEIVRLTKIDGAGEAIKELGDIK